MRDNKAVVILTYIYLAVLGLGCSMWDLVPSPGIAACIGSMESQPLYHQGGPAAVILSHKILKKKFLDWFPPQEVTRTPTSTPLLVDI